MQSEQKDIVILKYLLPIVHTAVKEETRSYRNPLAGLELGAQKHRYNYNFLNRKFGAALVSESAGASRFGSDCRKYSIRYFKYLYSAFPIHYEGIAMCSDVCLFGARHDEDRSLHSQM